MGLEIPGLEQGMKSIKLFCPFPSSLRALRGGDTHPFGSSQQGMRRARIKFALGWEAFRDVDFPGVGMELACGFLQASEWGCLAQPQRRADQSHEAGSLKHFQGLEMFGRHVKLRLQARL